MSDDLWGEYKATEFWVEDHGERFCIMVDKRSLELDRFLTLHRVESWAYVTAHNQRFQLLILGDNALRHQQLLDRIVRDGYSVLEGRGIGSDPDWVPEDSYLIINIPRADAISLGYDFGQNAIVVGRIGNPSRLSCSFAMTSERGDLSETLAKRSLLDRIPPGLSFLFTAVTSQI